MTSLIAAITSRTYSSSSSNRNRPRTNKWRFGRSRFPAPSDDHDFDPEEQDISQTQNTGTLDNSAAGPRLMSREALERVPEDDGAMEFSTSGLDGEGDEADEDEWQDIVDALEERGLYPGSYRRLVLMYTITPLTFLIAFVFLLFLPTIIHPRHAPPISPPGYPYTKFVPYPLPEILTSSGAFALAYLLRAPIFSGVSYVFNGEITAWITAQQILGALIHAFVNIFLRLAILPLLSIPHSMNYPYPTWKDAAFRRIWLTALFFSLAEAIVVISQGYASIAIYRPVLVSVRKIRSQSSSRSPFQARAQAKASPSTSPHIRQPQHPHDEETAPLLPTAPLSSSSHSDRDDVDVDSTLEDLINLRARQELEAAFGVAFIKIPSFFPPLQRFSALMLSLGMMLLLGSAWVRSPLSEERDATELLDGHDGASQTPLVPTLASNPNKSALAFQITFPLLAALQAALSFLACGFVVARIGTPSVVYITLLISLGTFFAGLATWDALS